MDEIQDRGERGKASAPQRPIVLRSVAEKSTPCGTEKTFTANAGADTPIGTSLRSTSGNAC